MHDVTTQLRHYGEQLDRDFPDLTLFEIGVGADRPVRLLPARAARRGLLVAAAAAAAALVLIGGMALLTRIIGAGDPPVVTTPEPPPTIQTLPSEWPLGVIIASESGIAVVPFDSPDEPILLQSDDRYRGISWAISDHRGGLIFTHDMTPPPWEPGSVLWLRAGASAPEVLIDPDRGAALSVIGVATSAEGHALLVYAVRTGENPSRIMVADLDDGGSIRQFAELDGWVDENFGRYWVSAGGGVAVAFEDRDGSDCFAVTVLSVDDGSHVPAGIDCIAKEGIVVWPRVSHDGRSLAVRRESTVTVIELASGDTLEEEAIGTVDDRIVPSPGGWLVSIATGTGLRLMGLDGVERLRIELTGLGALLSDFVHRTYFVTDFYHHPLVLAQTIGLGSGSGEVPCRPTTAELEDQDLPESCDYEGLAALAVEHTAHLFVEGGVSYPPGGHSEERLVSSWIAAGLTKPQAAGMVSREPLASLAALLRTRPAHVDDIAHWPVYLGPPDDPMYSDFNPEPSGCVWVWPALYVGAEGDPGDGALWSAHYDYRIGIAADGTWRFFMAHFYERGVSPNPPLCGDG
jgi:hypothetical protein